MKKKVLLSGLLAITLSLFCLGACETPDNSDVPNKEVSIVLNKETVEIKKYEQLELIPTVENSTQTITWMSSNPAVATVENGVLTALSEGTTTITANVAGETAQCAVTVVAPVNLPALVLDKEQVEVMYNGTLTVSAKVVFDGVDYASDYAFEIVDTDVATVDVNGVVSGLAPGESTTLTVSCVWRGAILTESIPVSVKEVITLSWADYDGETIALSTTNRFGGATSYTANPLVKQVEEVVTNPQLTWFVEDEDGNESDLFDVSAAGQISVTGKVGIAYVYYKYTSTSGKTYSSERLAVSCEAPIVDISPVEMELGVGSDNKENTSLALSAAMFGLASGVTVTSVTDITDGEKALTVSDGVVSGVSSGEYTWLVGNSAGYYQKVNVTLATLIISNAEELTQMTAILNASVKESETHTDGTYTYQKYYGYFVMDANVDYGGNAFVSAMGCRDTNVENGFMGTFDGRGYTISNIKFNRANVTVGNTTNKHVTTGLFGALGSTGVVKNLNLTGVNLANTYATVIGIATFGKVENLNIEITNMAANGSGVSMYAYTMWKDSTGSTHHGGAELRNTVIELNTSGTVTLGTDGGATFFFNISGDAADYQGKFTNNYYIANGKLSSANTWVQNATQSGRFEATGNNNYMFNNATVLTATSYTKGSETCEVSTGTTISTAIVMIDNVRVSATVSNGVITLSAEALDKLSAGAHTLTVLSGETYLEGTLTVA